MLQTEKRCKTDSKKQKNKKQKTKQSKRTKNAALTSQYLRSAPILQGALFAEQLNDTDIFQ